ncbi:MAG: NifB/NifX family molybdenum-iron cluster-binding protein [Lachnospiraceae bacterium]|nr:NifB/NifX family molybdenum-iron cluster-binding protein [Lachnospiraceae bacterium]
MQKGKIRRLENRKIPSYCGARQNQSQDVAMHTITDTIKDCEIVLVMRIGEKPKQELLKQGKRVVETCGAVADELEKFK